MIASDWRALGRGMLRGFCCLELPPALMIKDCALHQKDGRRWVGLPAKPLTNREGSPKLGDNGKQVWVTYVEIPDKAKAERFQKEGLAAIDLLLGEDDLPP